MFQLGFSSSGENFFVPFYRWLLFFNVSCCRGYRLLGANSIFKSFNQPLMKRVSVRLVRLCLCLCIFYFVLDFFHYCSVTFFSWSPSCSLFLWNETAALITNCSTWLVKLDRESQYKKLIHVLYAHLGGDMRYEVVQVYSSL